jgi:hypothetical protein
VPHSPRSGPLYHREKKNGTVSASRRTPHVAGIQKVCLGWQIVQIKETLLARSQEIERPLNLPACAISAPELG